MIVGGGPAGMEAARVAALRGHDVSIYEKENKLGGSVRIAAMVKGVEKEPVLDLVDYLTRQVENLALRYIWAGM